MKESKRQKQVSTIIQREFSTVLQTEGSYIYGDEALVTVTRVRMTNDLGDSLYLCECIQYSL